MYDLLLKFPAFGGESPYIEEFLLIICLFLYAYSLQGREAPCVCSLGAGRVFD